jgi:hypothetical protein
MIGWKGILLLLNPSYDITDLPSEIRDWILREDIEIVRDELVPVDQYKFGSKLQHGPGIKLESGLSR